MARNQYTDMELRQGLSVFLDRSAIPEGRLAEGAKELKIVLKEMKDLGSVYTRNPEFKLDRTPDPTGNRVFSMTSTADKALIDGIEAELQDMVTAMAKKNRDTAYLQDALSIQRGEDIPYRTFITKTQLGTQEKARIQDVLDKVGGLMSYDKAGAKTTYRIPMGSTYTRGNAQVDAYKSVTGIERAVRVKKQREIDDALESAGIDPAIWPTLSRKDQVLLMNQATAFNSYRLHNQNTEALNMHLGDMMARRKEAMEYYSTAVLRDPSVPVSPGIPINEEARLARRNYIAERKEKALEEFVGNPDNADTPVTRSYRAKEELKAERERKARSRKRQRMLRKGVGMAKGAGQFLLRTIVGTIQAILGTVVSATATLLKINGQVLFVANEMRQRRITESRFNIPEGDFRIFKAFAKKQNVSEDLLPKALGEIMSAWSAPDFLQDRNFEIIAPLLEDKTKNLLGMLIDKKITNPEPVLNALATDIATASMNGKAAMKTGWVEPNEAFMLNLERLTQLHPAAAEFLGLYFQAIRESPSGTMEGELETLGDLSTWWRREGGEPDETGGTPTPEQAARSTVSLADQDVLEKFRERIMQLLSVGADAKDSIFAQIALILNNIYAWLGQILMPVLERFFPTIADSFRAQWRKENAENLHQINTVLNEKRKEELEKALKETGFTGSLEDFENAYDTVKETHNIWAFGEGKGKDYWDKLRTFINGSYAPYRVDNLMKARIEAQRARGPNEALVANAGVAERALLASQEAFTFGLDMDAAIANPGETRIDSDIHRSNVPVFRMWEEKLAPVIAAKVIGAGDAIAGSFIGKIPSVMTSGVATLLEHLGLKETPIEDLEDDVAKEEKALSARLLQAGTAGSSLPERLQRDVINRETPITGREAGKLLNDLTRELEERKKDFAVERGRGLFPAGSKDRRDQLTAEIRLFEALQAWLKAQYTLYSNEVENVNQELDKLNNPLNFSDTKLQDKYVALQQLAELGAVELKPFFDAMDQEGFEKYRADLYKNLGDSEEANRILIDTVKETEEYKRRGERMAEEALKELEQTSQKLDYVNRPEEEIRLRNIREEQERHITENVSIAKDEIQRVVAANSGGRWSSVEDILNEGGTLELASQGPQDTTLTVNVYFNGELTRTLTQTLSNRLKLDRDIKIESIDIWKQFDNWFNSPSPMPY